MNILDFIFPTTCLKCKKPGSYICKDCLSKVKKAKQICIQCDKPSIDGFTHAKCTRPQALDGVFSIWNYEGVVRCAILKIKYNYAYSIANDIAKYMVNYINQEFTPLPSKPVLVPIPLHRLRKNWRGFNQVEEIGKILAKKLGWGFEPSILIRSKKTTPQVELKGDDRRKNVRGIFSINKNTMSTVNTNSQRSIVIFDDVLTTGATIKEAAKVLKRNGAKNVWGLTICS